MNQILTLDPRRFPLCRPCLFRRQRTRKRLWCRTQFLGVERFSFLPNCQRNDATARSDSRSTHGSRHTYIATLVERHSRYVMLAKVPNKKTETVVNALIEQAHPLPTELYKSLTWDRGLEMADHKRFTPH